MTYPVSQNTWRRAFTLIELLVAVTLLVIVILAVGSVFRSTGRAIRTSNATMEADANVRAVMRQIANDVSRMDRDGYLVIRSNWGLSPTRSQISFLAHGGFDNRTGAFDPTVNSSSGNVRAHAAHIWYGFCLTPEDMTSGLNVGTTIAQDNAARLNDVSIGGANSNAPQNMAVLGRHVFLMMPSSPGSTFGVLDGAGVSVPAHANIARNAGTINVASNEAGAHPSSGRTSVAALTPSQLMARMRYEKYQSIHTPAFLAMGNNNFIDGYSSWTSPFDRTGWVEGGMPEPIPLPFPQSGLRLIPTYNGADYWYEARYYCYPFKVLRTPLSGVSSDASRNVVNGLMRMSPTLLKWADEFLVDWTDGTTNSDGNLRWYGDSSRTQSSVHVTTPDNMNAVPTWPPLDYYVMSYWSGGSSDWNNTLLPPVTDKSGELRAFGNVLQAPSSSYYPYNGRTEIITRDNYTAVFSFDNKNRWPKALRFRLRVDMAQTEVVNFANTFNRPRRTYSQVIWLPQ